MIIPELSGEDEWQEAKEMEGEGPGRAKDHRVQRAHRETVAFLNDSSQGGCGTLQSCGSPAKQHHVTVQRTRQFSLKVMEDHRQLSQGTHGRP